MCVCVCVCVCACVYLCVCLCVCVCACVYGFSASKVSRETQIFAPIQDSGQSSPLVK